MKFYVVGLGSIGLRHARNLMALGHEVYASDPNKNDIPGIKWGDPGDADAWVIATPTVDHRDQLIRAIVANVPIFIEKPIIHNKDLGDATFIKKYEKLIAVGNNLRFHPTVQALKKDIIEQKMGRPIWAFIPCAQYNDKQQYLRDGVTLNWGAHEIDLALHLFGPARVAGASIDKDDTIADIILVHGEWYGTRSIVHLDYLTRPEEVRCPMIFGENGSVAIDLPLRTMMWKYSDDGPPGQSVGAGSYDDDYLNEMQAFADAVEGKKPWPGATVHEALEVIKIINAAKAGND